MAKKKIVSIEDRIPKLKQARKKKANRRLMFYMGLFAVLISLVVYLQSPLSHVQKINILGNTTIEKEKIEQWSGIALTDNFWNIDGEQIEEKITVHPEIEEAVVNRTFFSTVEIEVKEYDRVGYAVKEGVYYPILSNGVLLKNNGMKSAGGDAPILLEFEENEYLISMAKELHSLPASISSLISEIIWQPTEKNPYKITLFMNDGYQVEGTIRRFSTNMETYPSIVAQLNPDKEGILHIGIGAYFETEPTGEESEVSPETEAVEEVALNNEIQ